jgi:glycosyltransferase involved in cell wall biosynthesis
MASEILHVCALTQGINVPSSRFRWRQYLPFLVEAGIHATEMSTRWGGYPPNPKILRPLWLIANSIDAVKVAQDSNNYDIIFLQREMISTLCTGELLLRKPFVFDVDDAIFLNQRYSSIDRIAKRASTIICGNDFLANYFSVFGNVKILPTSVDTQRYVPSNLLESRKIIGWSGMSCGFKYLYEIEYVLETILNKYPDVILKVIADSPPSFSRLPQEQVVFQRWHPDTEVSAIQEFTAGIMPLTDGVWEKGKCSFKMLTYMAVGVPVVVSSVGMNIDVLRHGEGEAGFLVRSHDEWIDALSCLLTDQHKALKMGEIGRRIIEKHYATNIIGSKLASILKEQI